MLTLTETRERKWSMKNYGLLILTKNSKLLPAKLHTIAPLESGIKSLKCLAHIAGLLENMPPAYNLLHRKNLQHISQSQVDSPKIQIILYGKHEVIEDFSSLQENDSSFMVKMH